ncbi:MAG TPA: prepilin peptidase [Sphingomicrobium sp.]|nr:prepilin peptidase [Sphingomicrobium sp.]
MNLALTAPIWLLVIVGLLLLAAAIEDAMRLRISNLTCLGVFVCGLIAIGYAGISLPLYQNALVFAALLAVGTLMFGAGQMGGGDVKLLAALGLWFSFLAAAWFIATVCIAGGLLALLSLATRPLRRKLANKSWKEIQIPYGVAIALGAAVILSSQLGMWGSHYQKPDPFAVRPLG